MAGSCRFLSAHWSLLGRSKPKEKIAAVNISGDAIEIQYSGQDNKVVVIKKSISKLDTELAAAGEDPNVCKPCYMILSASRYAYCPVAASNPSDANHNSATSPAHTFKLNVAKRKELLAKCAL